MRMNHEVFPQRLKYQFCVRTLRRDNPKQLHVLEWISDQRGRPSVLAFLNHQKEEEAAEWIPARWRVSGSEWVGSELTNHQGWYRSGLQRQKCRIWEIDGISLNWLERSWSRLEFFCLGSIDNLEHLAGFSSGPFASLREICALSRARPSSISNDSLYSYVVLFLRAFHFFSLNPRPSFRLFRLFNNSPGDNLPVPIRSWIDGRESTRSSSSHRQRLSPKASLHVQRPKLFQMKLAGPNERLPSSCSCKWSWMALSAHLHGRADLGAEWSQPNILSPEKRKFFSAFSGLAILGSFRSARESTNVKGSVIIQYAS